MNIIFFILWKIIIEYDIHVINVNSSRCNLLTSTNADTQTRIDEGGTSHV